MIKNATFGLFIVGAGAVFMGIVIGIVIRNFNSLFRDGKWWND